MAKVAGLIKLLLVVSVVLGLAGYAAAQEAAASGGKTEVNPENNAKRLVFTEVIKAEKQVVAGEKYFLTIKATSEDGQTKAYESEMWVKPGDETVHEMLNFAPAAAA
nr:cysteine proteinase inhibitor B-like [Ipomoea batatas]GMD81745.1 cysteine proteinase inhibitor B-like [Ipomoea batatas]GME18429.1 cysteine proteinase inhibitor B-like [Ipomoea batatas]GME18435.1 cysteine proteinase inhibitor B-like [Ipomoea batatas]